MNMLGDKVVAGVMQSSAVNSKDFDDVDCVYDFSVILDRVGLQYKNVDYYYQVSELPKFDWVICISITHYQILSLLEALIPILSCEKTCFAIARDIDIAYELENGSLGYNYFAQVIKIYPHDSTNARNLEKLLVEVANGYRGPAVPNSVSLGGVVYALSRSLSPESNSWPFKKEYLLPSILKSKFLKDKYRVVSVIKSDPKGNVFKAVRLKGWRIQWCFIKEGKRDMFIDESGRDIRDRLEWQFKLHVALCGIVSIPKPYEIFHIESNTYLVMEFVKGKSLQQLINETYQSTPTWWDLSFDKKAILINHLLDIVSLIHVLHANGYIHRDITPVNVIFDGKKNRWVLIDLELTYHSLMLEKPYLLGTNGYMSPEQMSKMQPHFSQDVYSIGALMITVVTGLNAVRFNSNENEMLASSLLFLTGDVALVDLIVACLRTDPMMRPSLEDIIDSLKKYNPKNIVKYQGFAVNFNFESLVQMIFSVLKNPLMVNSAKIWISNIPESKEIKSRGRQVCHGLHSGVSGILYFIKVLRDLGITTSGIDEMRSASLNNIDEYFLKRLSSMSPGLYHGAAGVAVALAKSSNVNDDIKVKVMKCFDLRTSQLTISDGVAGQGLSAMMCDEYIGNEIIDEVLRRDVELLLSAQKGDGSWLLPRQGRSSFDDGVAGIVYFLLVYGVKYNDTQALNGAAKGLKWLERYMNRGAFYGFSFGQGIAGVIFSFIKAYQSFNDPLYKDLALRGLSYIPKRSFFNGNFTFLYGGAGIGEVYLEAAKVFNAEEWLAHARWISDLLVSMYKSDVGELKGHWIVDGNKLPTADLMIGNCGILHFLLRSVRFSSVPFPVFNLI